MTARTSPAPAPLLLPFLAAATGIALFSVMDGLMKSASIAAGVFSAMLLRSVIGAVIMLPLWRRHASGALHRRAGWPGMASLKVHALRSAVCAGMATSFFYGLVRIPMAEGIALSFIAPLIALFLAAVLLGEAVSRRAVIASLLGLAGVIVIAAARLLGPGGGSDLSGEAGWGIAAILLSAVLYAWNLVIQRQQAQMAGPAEIAFFQSLFIAAILSLGAPWLWHMPPPSALAHIAGGAVLSVASLMLMSWGYARAEAQVLLPVEYSAFIWAALTGWWMFGEALTGATIAGAALIVIACWIGTRAHVEQTAL